MSRQPLFFLQEDIMKRWKYLCILILQTLLLTLITILCVVPLSCRVSEEGIMLLGGDFISPVLEEVTVVDEKTVAMTFSEKVKMKSFVVSEQIKEISDSSEHSQTSELSPALKAAAGAYGKVEAECQTSEDGCRLTFSALENYEVGRAYEIFGVVEDRAGNSLSFCVPFCGYNSRLPKLVMTEVQPKYKKYKEEYRCEYVELLALTGGNLSGLELYSGADGDAKKYTFPALELSAGQVILVHLRNAGAGAVTEEDNLNESTAYHSAKNVRDIWSSNDKARLSDSADIIVIRNSIDESILDAIMYAPEDATEWGKGLGLLADQVLESGIYDSVQVCDVEVNAGLGSSAQYSFCRSDAQELQQRAMAGEFSEGGESFEAYPVKRGPDTWAVKKVNPGSL